MDIDSRVIRSMPGTEAVVDASDDIRITAIATESGIGIKFGDDDNGNETEIVVAGKKVDFSTNICLDDRGKIIIESDDGNPHNSLVSAEEVS